MRAVTSALAQGFAFGSGIMIGLLLTVMPEAVAAFAAVLLIICGALWSASQRSVDGQG